MQQNDSTGVVLSHHTGLAAVWIARNPAELQGRANRISVVATKSSEAAGLTYPEVTNSALMAPGVAWAPLLVVFVVNIGGSCFLRRGKKGTILEQQSLPFVEVLLLPATRFESYFRSASSTYDISLPFLAISLPFLDISMKQSSKRMSRVLSTSLPLRRGGRRTLAARADRRVGTASSSGWRLGSGPTLRTAAGVGTSNKEFEETKHNSVWIER